MIDEIPNKLIKKADLNKWEQYAANIGKSPYIKKYFEVLLKQWVEKVSYPLAIPLVASFFRGRLDDFENRLKEWEGNLGENTLKKIINELKDEKSKFHDDINKKIKSLFGEVMALDELLTRQSYNTVEKINEIGDWKCDGNTIVSVKTKQGLDLNYELIDNTIYSLWLIEENYTLRKYRFELKEQKDINDAFRKKIIKFLELHLIHSLDSINDNIKQAEVFKIRAIRNDKNPTDYLEWEALVEKKNMGYSIEFLFRENDKDVKHLNRSLNITFENRLNRNNKNFYDSSYDTDADMITDKLKANFINNLHKILEEEPNRLDGNYMSFCNTKKDKEFIGWINILVHAFDQKPINNNKTELEQLVKGIVGKRDYKIYIAFCPSALFELKEPFIIEI